MSLNSKLKCYRITADYRPNNPNKPTYDYIVPSDVKKKEIKDYFSDVYSWLKIYQIEEMDVEDAGNWALRLCRKPNKYLI